MNWFLDMFNCVIFFFHAMARFKRGRVVIMPKYFNPTTFFVPVFGLCMSCFVFTSSLFYVAGVIWGKYFTVPVYNVVLGPAAACPVVWEFRCRSVKTHGWPWADIFHCSGVVVSLTYSPYPFSLYLSNWDVFHVWTRLKILICLIFMNSKIFLFVLVPLSKEL